MGMFDTIYDVPVKCPRCGDEEPKSVQIKSGPQCLSEYEFGKDKIEIYWTYGLISAMVGKYIVMVFPMIAYQYVQKELETTFLKYTYWSLYIIIMIVTIITVLRVDINNIMEIINKLQYNV